MGEPRNPKLQSKSKPPPPPPPTPAPPTTCYRQPSMNKNKAKVFRVVRSVFRSFPMVTSTSLKFPFPGGHLDRGGSSSKHVTGTLFGYKNGRVSLSIQENPYTLPLLILELGLETSMLQREMSTGFVRISLECEKESEKEKKRLVEEPLWTMYCNGKKSGYGVKREATEEDLGLMDMLQSMAMGNGVLPGKSNVEGPDGEIAYIRAHFDRVVGSKDSETLYMVSPDRNNGTELSIFFVRV